MRIAVCFSGEPRFVKEGFELFSKNFLDRNPSVDFFVHTWFNMKTCGLPLYSNELSSFGTASIDENAIELIQSLYKPKRISVDTPKTFKDSGLDWKQTTQKYFAGATNVENVRDIKLNNFYSFFFSNMRTILLKREEELANDFVYDAVMKCRFDGLLKIPLILENFDMEYLHYQENGQPSNMVSDWINFSNSSNMDLFGSIFFWMAKFTKQGVTKDEAVCPESIIRLACDHFGITTRSGFFRINLPRHGEIK